MPGPVRVTARPGTAPPPAAACARRSSTSPAADLTGGRARSVQAPRRTDTCNLTPPDDIAALDWIQAASIAVSALDDPAVVRAALGACASTLAGKAAAATTQRRKRSVLYNAIGYAVELGLLPANPVDKIQWKTPGVAETVDRRVVAGPALARALLAGVRAQGARGEHLEAFYGCIYYAATRPSEAVLLTEPDLTLPSRGWGRIDLATSAARAGRDWTDDGTARQARGLKHRAPRETRSVPIPPVLVAMLRAHLRTYGTPPTGGCSAPAAAASSRTAPTAQSGRPPAPPRSPPPSTPPPSPAAPTTSATPPYPCG